ncbi:MAG: WYL domain-containing protein [Campylobacterota bacterium]|nr:WYL domain-containing protein [Campylobacterota bacterium]
MKKHDYDKILYRLTNIWQRLREGEVLSVKDLAIEYNVSTKTIQRDFNERLINRLPIEKNGHKWQVKPGHSLDKNLSFEEDLVLDVLKELASSMGSSFGSKANTMFNKIQNTHDNPIFSKIEIEDISDKTDLIKQLQDAIIQSKQIEFHFKSKYRFVEPYKITTFEGYWYLYGNDVSVDKLKTFYIKDIEKLIITNKSFTKDPQALSKLKSAINVWFEPNSELFEVRLLADAEVGKYFIRRPLSSSQLITKQYDDGSVELLLTATSERELIYELKKWQPNLLVLEPKSLATKMLDISRSFYDKQVGLMIV